MTSKEADSKMRATYMQELAAEIVTGDLGEKFSRPEFDRGHEMEPMARDYYALLNDVEPRKVAFVVRDGVYGASPDSLVGDNGLLEIKTQRADLLIKTLRADKFTFRAFR